MSAFFTRLRAGRPDEGTGYPAAPGELGCRLEVHEKCTGLADTRAVWLDWGSLAGFSGGPDQLRWTGQQALDVCWET